MFPIPERRRFCRQATRPEELHLDLIGRNKAARRATRARRIVVRHPERDLAAIDPDLLEGSTAIARIRRLRQ